MTSEGMRGETEKKEGGVSGRAVPGHEGEGRQCVVMPKGVIVWSEKAPVGREGGLFETGRVLVGGETRPAAGKLTEGKFALFQKKKGGDRPFDREGER